MTFQLHYCLINLTMVNKLDKNFFCGFVLINQLGKISIYINKIMRIKIRILEAEDVTENYVKWFLDNDVTQFSLNQYGKFSYDGQCAYVASCLTSTETDLYGIFDEKNHIGNIIISDLNSPHKRSEISYVVGEKLYWGKGVATFAISEIINLAKEKYKLNKLFAGIAEDNVGSQKVLEKNGFIFEGRRFQHLLYGEKYHNQLDYGLVL